VVTEAACLLCPCVRTGRCGHALGGGGGAAADGSDDDDVEKYAVQVLVLAHAYQVPWLKRSCEAAIGARLTADSVVDVLQLAALCDAPRLHLRCTRLLAKEFKAVERTEAWRFLQENDPWQELDILQRLHDADMVRPLRDSFLSPSEFRSIDLGSKRNIMMISLSLSLGALVVSGDVVLVTRP
jgi:hypothetical protein